MELITLESVRLAAPEETEEAVATAERIVESETQAFAARQKTRNIDSAIVALRSHTMEVLDEELDKVRSQFGCTAATEQLELAMRRMVKSLCTPPRYVRNSSQPRGEPPTTLRRSKRSTESPSTTANCGIIFCTLRFIPPQP